MSTRILYIDDSGKPEKQHASGAVALAGFAINAEDYPTFSRRILGAKGAYFPRRGVPQKWEIKSVEIIKPNPWKRAKNRNFCAEIERLLKVAGATTYAATIDKGCMKHAMTLATSMPLQLQILAEHFAVECETLGRTGMLVSDWSGHQHDQHACGNAHARNGISRTESAFSKGLNALLRDPPGRGYSGWRRRFD